MQTDLILAILLACIPAAFSYLLDYSLGKPMANEINTRAIFFSYSYKLAKRRIGRGRQRELEIAFKDMLNSDNPDTRRDGVKQMKTSVMMLAQKEFGIEQAFGMCIFCTNVWISFIAATIFFFFVPVHFNPFFFYLLIPIFSHSILRKL